MIWWWRVTCCPVIYFCSAGTGVYNIFSIAQILDESFIDPMFVELDGMSWFNFNVNWVKIFVIPNYRFFAPNFFNFKIIFALSIFENVFADRVLTSTWIMLLPIIVGEIQHLLEWEAPQNVIIRNYISDGSLWVHPSAVINILPILSTSNISTTLQTPKGEVVLITVYPYGCLVGVDDYWFNSKVVPSPDYYGDIYQLEWSVMVLVDCQGKLWNEYICNLISYDLLLLDLNVFNMTFHGLLNVSLAFSYVLLLTSFKSQGFIWQLWSS